MKVASLGSGSRGNSLLVSARGGPILVDAGFSGAEIARRLRALGVAPDRIRAVVLTHEHRDHTAGAGVAARRWGWPLHMSPATREACRDLLTGREEVRLFRGDEPFRVASLEIRPFRTAHDARAPLAVTVTDPGAGVKLGVATDLGRPTTPVRHALSESHFLVLEANHDELLLRDGPYPWSVKERIAGSRGHLSNRLAGELARELWHPELCGILLAHLSRECNRPELAREALRRALRETSFRGPLAVAAQDRPTRIFDVAELRRRLRFAREDQLDLFTGRGRRPREPGPS